jgi:hypothetical protein
MFFAVEFNFMYSKVSISTTRNSFAVGTPLPETKKHKESHSEYLRAREGAKLEIKYYIYFLEIRSGF